MRTPAVIGSTSCGSRLAVRVSHIVRKTCVRSQGCVRRHHLAQPHAAGDTPATVAKMTPADRKLGQLTREWAMRLDNGTKTNQPKRAVALFNSHPEVG